MQEFHPSPHMDIPKYGSDFEKTKDRRSEGSDLQHFLYNISAKVLCLACKVLCKPVTIYLSSHHLNHLSFCFSLLACLSKCSSVSLDVLFSIHCPLKPSKLIFQDLPLLKPTSLQAYPFEAFSDDPRQSWSSFVTVHLLCEQPVPALLLLHFSLSNETGLCQSRNLFIHPYMAKFQAYAWSILRIQCSLTKL